MSKKSRGSRNISPNVIAQQHLAFDASAVGLSIIARQAYFPLDAMNRLGKQLSAVTAALARSLETPAVAGQHLSAVTAALARSLETPAVAGQQLWLGQLLTNYSGDLSGSLAAASLGHAEAAKALAAMPFMSEAFTRTVKQLTPALTDHTAQASAEVLRSLDLSASMRTLAASQQDSIKIALESFARAQAAWAQDASSLVSKEAKWLRALGGQTSAHGAKEVEQETWPESEGGAEVNSAGLSAEPVPSEHRQIDLVSSLIVGIVTLVLLQYAYMFIYSTATGNTFDDRAMTTELRVVWWLLISGDGPVGSILDRLSSLEAVICLALLTKNMRQGDRDSY